MKIEFLSNSSPDCPLIRIYDFDPAAACKLHEVILSLANHETELVAFNELPFVESVGGSRLIGELGNRDKGLLPSVKNPSSFVWILAEEGWKEVAGLIEPFCESGASGFQWLNSNGGIRILLSPTGNW